MSKHSIWLIAFPPVVAAARNCTVRAVSDNETVGWQSGGCYRSTWNIISTCLSTIVACTWSIQHLNLPARDDSGWKKTKRKIKWMIIIENNKPVEWPWWFRNPPLSWLPYCRQYLKNKDLESQDVESLSKEKEWTLSHCYFANMGGFISTTGGKRVLVTAQQLAEDSTYATPEVTKEDIADKSKQDWLAKLFAAIQIMQLILSIITRHIQGVHFSQLETVTLSFAICGVLIYCTYFHKPQRVDRAIELKNNTPISNDNPQTPVNDTQNAAAQLLSPYSDKTYDSFWAIMLNKQRESTPRQTSSSKLQKQPRIPNDNIPIYKGNNDVHPAIILLALASGLFGAIHAIAWGFEFPTEVEKLLWQIATCIAAASPVVGLLATPLAQLTKASGDPELFAGNCIRLLQEYSWHTSNIAQASSAIKELEEAISTGRSKRYSDIFLASETRDNTLILDLRDFLDLKGGFEGLRTEPFELHDDKWFLQNFHLLVSSINGDQTKRIDDAARTDIWPRQPLLPRGVNQSILYMTGFLYCASRLILLAVSLSSIRKMPGSVYIATNWTEYVPTFGAMGG
ncbi:hypothetical protein V8C35DRAFT_327997 [Trichoderma chlorosporum]